MKKGRKFNTLHALIVAVLIWFVMLIVACICPQVLAEGALPDTPARPRPARILREDPHEPEHIEQALVDQGYLRDDIPLSYELQDYLHTAAEEAGIPYELALAVVWKETNFRNVVGDDGASTGFMQVQKRWHEERMERLGVTDLADPYGNFRVGCDYLGELISRYEDLHDVLTAYNSGSPGRSGYSESGIGYMEGL